MTTNPYNNATPGETASVPSEGGRSGRKQQIGLWLGPCLVLILLLISPPASLVEITGGEEQAHKAWYVLCLFSLMAVWWVTEALPIPVTALLPLVFLPMAGVAPLKAISGNYMHPVVVLLMGGFIVAKAIERWNLHTRIALNIVVRAGDRPSSLLAGFMVSGALMSMWISNSATSIMLMPIGISVAAALYADGAERRTFSCALLLAIAYSCSVGGLGTPIGTPTNLIAIGYLEETKGMTIGFGQWMSVGLPVVLIILPIMWWILTRVVFNLSTSNTHDGRNVVRDQIRALGAMTTPEKRTMAVLAFVAITWIFRGFLLPLKSEDLFLFPLLKALAADHFSESFLQCRPFSGLTDHMIAIIGVLLCFLIPSGDKKEQGGALLDWKTAESIPWGPLLLFGGGLALASVIRSSGLGGWFGAELSGLSVLPMILLIVVFTTFVIFLTEVMSNVATVSSLLPILGATALEIGINVELIAIPIALASSCAFMLPMATGPNAVVHGSGLVSMQEMTRAGLWINLVAIVVITGLSMILLPVLF